MHRDTGTRSWRHIIALFIHCHHLLFHRDNVIRFCRQFLEAKNVPVLPWPAYSTYLSSIEHVRDALDQRVREIVFQFPPISRNFAQPLKEWDNIPQSTA
jgi:hypothetical protein